MSEFIYFPEAGPDDDPEKLDDSKKSTDKKKDKKLTIWEKLLADDQEKKDKQPPDDELAGDEKKLVIKDLLPKKREEIDEETEKAEAGSIEEAEAIAVDVFYDNLETFADQHQEIDETDIDNIAEQTIQEIDSDESEDMELADEIPEPITGYEAEPVVDLPEEDAEHAATSSKPPIIPPTVVVESSPPLEEDIADVGSITRAEELIAPRPEAVYPTSITPEKEPENDFEQGSTAGAALVGGILGYLIGRRRGRINTEKKLLPIQQKLEEEVKTLHDQVLRKEHEIRRRTRDQLKSQSLVKQVEIIERLEARHKKQLNPEMTPEKLEQKPTISSKELDQLTKSENRIKPVELMTVAELLIIAEQIKVENSTLKKLFETGRLNEESLRRIVQSHLKGERYERLLSDNLLSPEFDRSIQLDKDQTIVRTKVDPLAEALAAKGIVLNEAPSLYGGHSYSDSAPHSSKSRVPTPVLIGVTLAIVISILLIVFLFSQS